MRTLTVTAKGQITLPRDLLKHLGVQPGEKIAVDKFPDGRIEIKVTRSTGKISDVFDLLKKKDRPSLSIEDINDLRPAVGQKKNEDHGRNQSGC
jgi:AbrB family looped-hinge helix DNA binding protein